MDEVLRILSESEPSALMPNISSEQIQKCLEENSVLIRMIMESQRLGRLNDREILTDQLQRNLTLLTKLADVMLPPPPPPPPPPPQMMRMMGQQQQGLYPREVLVPWPARQPRAEASSEPRHFLQQQQQQQHYLPNTQFGAPFGNSGFTHNFFAP